MKVLVFTPAPPGTTRGNRITAERWARLLRDIGHEVTITNALPLGGFGSSPVESPDALIAIHATKSNSIVTEFKRQLPRRPAIVGIAGTDLYLDLAGQRGIANQETALATLRLADRLIGLESEGSKSLAAEFQAKLRVIYQSAVPPASVMPVQDDVFEICVIGHLRTVKDPFLIAKAVKRLAASSRVRVVHIGAALDDEMESLARAESADNLRYEWLGSLPHDETLQILSRCRLTVMTSHSESAPSVLSEAVVAKVPLLSTNIPGVVGVIGADYPGLFPVGDESQLASLIAKAEANPDYLGCLQASMDRIKPLLLPEVERAALDEVLRGG